MNLSGTKLGFLSNSERALKILNSDWSNHPLGAPEEWPQSLCTAISMCLYAPTPQLIFWGDECFQFYNDHYNGPAAIGEPFRDPVQLPLIRQVMQSGEPVIAGTRHYSPIHIENGKPGEFSARSPNQQATSTSNNYFVILLSRHQILFSSSRVMRWR
ncbi:hypothetical protein [Chitinophaga sancti]|uniref:hypothetical protein n=1 Tax=Chitinophaga sancti TaxID=1004 RepID=UPI003F7A7579